MHHPAAEIVSIALRKIIKSNTGRKHASLTQECKELLESIHVIIPPLSAHSAAVVPPRISPTKDSTVSLEGQAAGATAEDNVSEPGSDTSGVSQSRLADKSPDPQTPLEHRLIVERKSSLAHRDSESSFEKAEAAYANINAKPEVEDGGASEASEAPTAQQQEDEAAALASCAAEEHARQQEHDRLQHEKQLQERVNADEKEQSASQLTLFPQDLHPRTEEAISDAAAKAVTKVMRMAVDTAKPPIVEVALECLQKLVAFRFLQGAVYSLLIDKPTKEGSVDTGEARSVHDPSSVTPQAEAIELMCRCDGIAHEGVELQILKGLLTATTSSSLTVHGQALLLAVRTCYNIYLMSRNEINQTTAKASLTQMLNVVFQRMEANSVLVDVKPILVTDVLGLPRSNVQDGNGTNVTVEVQEFLNKVVMVTKHNMQSTDEIRTSVAGAFSGRDHPQAASDSDDDKEQFRLRPREHGTVEDTKKEETRTTILQKDAFLVFRALCKLSIRTSDSATMSDPTAVRGKILALELLKILLENSGPTFRTNEKFLSAIRQYLCLSLLKNSASSIPQALQLSCSIFLSLLLKFRIYLKAEVGVFYPMILLKPLEPAPGGAQASGGAAAANTLTSGFGYRSVVLRMLRELSKDGQCMVDLFVNYDCDLESSNLFERTVNGLVKIAQTAPATTMDLNASQQESFLRQESLQGLVYLTEGLLAWYRHTSGTSQDDKSDDGQDDKSDAGFITRKGDASGGPSVGQNMDKLETGEDLTYKREYKLRFQEGIALFNRKPKKGIEFLQREGMLGTEVQEIAQFLARTEGLDKTLIGDYLGEREDVNLKVMHAYVDAMDFLDMEFDQAIRHFLLGFRLPGEAQKIDRLMEKFAERYVKCNAGSFKSADVAYVLAYSVIMLNTDAHNPQVKKKMTKEEFMKNNRGINDGADLPPEFMSALYERIVKNEIKMKDDDLMPTSTGGVQPQQKNNIFNVLLNLMGATKSHVSNEPSDEAIKRTLDYLHQKAKSASLVPATEADAVRPILEVIWAPLLGALSVLFDEYTDPRYVRLCLGGFAATVELTAQMGICNLRDIFITSLCNFTHLHSPSSMRYKNALAFKVLLGVAEHVGNHLEDRWVDVLRCISRWELLQQIASGMPTDAALFNPGNQKGGLQAMSEALQQRLKRLGGRGNDDECKTIDSLTMNEISIKRVHIGGTGSAFKKHDVDDRGIPQEVINSIDTSELNRVFMRSNRLDSEAVVHFVKSLCAISLDELRDAKAPRVFSLTKIVEIAHYNMMRIRLVWTKIWNVLSDYFIQVGCHANLSVAMYAVDSLRQLAMKFLERDELANYTFQNDFLRPFVVVMRQSQAVEIRELIIRCLSQMVLARVSNVKSGWKSMFMVFTTAANDKEPMIVRLAFETIEKIVREHFRHITETETTTFTDCVNCLIAFTNNPHSLDVALNSIAFLRFCAMKLAEGAIGDVNVVPEGLTASMMHPLRVVAIDYEPSTSFAYPSIPLPSPDQPPATAQPVEASISMERAGSNTSTCVPVGPVTSTQSATRTLKFIDRDEHVYFWFPLLAGLSELTFDPRTEIRQSALEVLFDTLKFHGSTFAESFWKRIFDSVLLPIFDHVRAEVTDTTTFTSEKKRQQEDAWLYETCTKCLQHLIDLFVQYYSVAAGLLERLLDLLKSFMNRTHQSLASVGVAAMVRLVTQAGPLMDGEQWCMTVQGIHDIIVETAPNGVDLVTPPPRPAAESSLPTRAYSLKEGVGARRLAKFKCQAAVQLLMVQAVSEMYASQHMHMAGPATTILLSALETIAYHARSIDMDMTLRRKLAVMQATDGVSEDKMVMDPPLLRLETEACHAFLSVLLYVSTESERPQIRSECYSEDRLVRLCIANLERFGLGISTAALAETHPPSTSSNAAPTSRTQDSSYATIGRTSNGLPITMASPAAEYASFSPLVVSTLRALASFDDRLFRAHLSSFFPLLTRLIRCDYAPAEVQKALSDLFLSRVGPLIGAVASAGS